MHDERDRLDAELLAAGDYARLLAMYMPVAHDRVHARVRGPAADDVVQEVMLRLYRELHAGKAYPVPLRVVVHNVTGWLIGAHFEGRELPRRRTTRTCTTAAPGTRIRPRVVPRVAG